MPELTDQDIADMKLDKLTEANVTEIIIDIGDYTYSVCGYKIVEDGYTKGFEVESVSREVNSGRIYYGEVHRRHIQDNYEDKLVEACL